MRSIREFRSMSGFARPFKAFFYQPAKVLDNHRKLAKARLTPIIEARLAEEEAAKKAGRPPIDYQDTLQWFRDIVRPEHKTSEAIAELQLGLSMVAIHTTAMSLTTVVLDLAAHPEYIQPLREEMEAVIKEDGGAVQKTTLRKMRKLDSFIKESFRGRVGLRRWPCQSPETRASYIFHAHRETWPFCSHLHSKSHEELHPLGRYLPPKRRGSSSPTHNVRPRPRVYRGPRSL